MEKGVDSPEWERHAAAVCRVEALEAAYKEVDAYCERMERRLNEAGALEERVVRGVRAAMSDKMDVRWLVRLFFEFVSMVGTMAKSLSDGLNELAAMKKSLSLSLRNVKELQRLYAEIVEKAVDEKNKLDEREKSLDARDALVPQCDGKRLQCPKWLPGGDLLLTDEERALNRWVGNGKRTRYYTERIKKCRTLYGMVEVIKEMYLAEDSITAKVVKSIAFYKASLPFVPEDNIAFRDRRKVRDAIAIMVKRENKRLYALEKTTDPDAAHRRGEALIKHAEQQERVRREKEEEERKKRRERRRKTGKGNEGNKK